MIDYLEIREQHYMNAEGTAEDKPCVEEVEQAINKRGFNAENISISHDGMQQTWRFTARISRM